MGRKSLPLLLPPKICTLHQGYMSPFMGGRDSVGMRGYGKPTPGIRWGVQHCTILHDNLLKAYRNCIPPIMNIMFCLIVILLGESSNIHEVTILHIQYPNKLQAPTHMSACIDSTDRQLCRYDRTIWPLLKIRSTKTNVAAKNK